MPFGRVAAIRPGRLARLIHNEGMANERPTLPPTATEAADVATYERECARAQWPLVRAILLGLVPSIPVTTKGK